MSLREHTRPGLGIIEPCLPSPAKAPPSGPGWLHEIKHDGFRILARRDGAGVRLITRHGNDFTHRFPFIEMAVKSLSVRSCLIDGEAIVCDESGLSTFELLRGYRSVTSAVLCAFDLLELNGTDLRRKPIEYRKGELSKILRAIPGSGLALTSTMTPMAKLSFARLAGLAVRVSCRSVSARLTVQGVRRIG
jgi:bifunctional non-homologous end joining protein LigD